MGEEKDVFFRPVGLVLDPSERLAPQGSLRRAENVVLRRQGILEPRPGFKSLYAAGDGTPPQGYIVRRLFSYAEKLLVSALSGSTWAHYWSSSFATAITGIGSPPTGRYQKSATMRKSLYTTSGTGIKKLTSSSDTAAESAGVEIMQGVLSHVARTGSESVLANGKQVAYRYVLRRTDANLYILRSAPTAWTQIVNTHATDGRDVQIIVPLATTNVAGDVIEVYRSLATTPPTEPNDELYLAQEYVVTSGDVSATYATITDRLPEDLLGAALYANATELGVSASKEVPPVSRDLAPFGGCMFYAYTTSRQRILALLKIAFGETDIAADLVVENGLTCAPSSLIGYTNGSPVVTSGFGTFGASVRVGMVLVEAGRDPETAGIDFAAGTTIVSVDSPTQVTVSTNALANGVAKTVTFCDIVTLNATKFYAWTSNSATKRCFFAEKPDATLAGIDATFADVYCTRRIAANLAYVVNVNTTAALPKVSAVPQDSGAFLTFEERALGGSTFTLIMTPRTMWDRDYGVSLTSAADENVNRLMWSAPDEPEAVPLVNYTPVGDARKEIIRIVPTRDALFIFKQDGVWRLTGTYPSFRVDNQDPILLLAEDGVDVFEDQIVAWTDRGVVVGGLSGFESISCDTIEPDLFERQNVNVAYPATPYRASMAAIPPEGLLVFGVSAADSDGKASKLYVFSAKTHGWTTWELVPRCTAYHLSDGKLYLGSPGSTYDLHKEKKTESSITDNSDTEYSVPIANIGTEADPVITFTIGATGYSPVVGDAVKTISAIALVTSVISSSKVTVDTPSALTVATATIYKPFQVEIEAIGVDAQDPSCLKQFARLDFVFEDTRGVQRVVFAARSDEDFTGDTETATHTRPTTAQFETWSWVVPRVCARGTRIYPRLSVWQACARFKLSGFSTRYTRLEGAWR